MTKCTFCGHFANKDEHFVGGYLACYDCFRKVRSKYIVGDEVYYIDEHGQRRCARVMSLIEDKEMVTMEADYGFHARSFYDVVPVL